MKYWGESEALMFRVSSFALIAIVVGVPVIGQTAGSLSQSGGTVQNSSRSVTMSVPLAWNGRILNDIIVQIAPDGAVAVETQSLRAELNKLLTERGIQRLDDTIGGDPFITLQELQAAGFEVEFNMSQLELVVVSIDPTLRPVQPLQGRREYEDPLQPSIEPARLSGYLNTNLNLVHRTGGGTGTPDLFLLGAARYGNVVLEIDGGFTEGLDGDYRFYRRAARAVYDEPESYRRWTAGDLELANTGMLQAPFLGGVAVEKSRRTFDPLSASANLGGRQIFLSSPSTVEVIINGSPYQTLDLQPGTYSLNDLPIQTGSNDVQLVIRDAAGREKVTRFDYFYDPIELKGGEEEYTVAVGVVANELNLQPDYSGNAAFIGTYRKALNDNLILGGGVQASEKVQVLSAETQFVPQIIPGSFSFQGAVSESNGTGLAMRGGYRVSTGNGWESKRFSATFDYESEDFRSVGDLSLSGFENLSVNATYGQALSERTSMVAGVNYFSRSGGRDQSTVFVDVNHRVTDKVRATAGVEYGTGSILGRNFGIRAGLSILLGNRHRGDARYQSRNQLARASLSRGSEDTVGSVGYSVNVQDSLGNSSVDGVVDYVGNRFEARASIASTGTSLGGITDEQTARLQVGTSFAFADGAFGIGRPIQDSFLLARPHSTLDGTDVITGRSLRGSKYEASSGLLGSAVVNRLSSYNTQDVQYDIDTLEAGYDIGAGVVRLEPPFRSGYKMVVGTDRFVSSVGFLQINGVPAQLVTGLITSEDDEGFGTEAFFTNSAGRFGIIGLAPGRSYTIRLNDSGRTFKIAIPKDNKGLYRLETINLQNESE